MEGVGSSGEEAVRRGVEVGLDGDEYDDAAFEEAFEIGDTAKVIGEHGFRRIALQFPDRLLRHSYRVVERLHGKKECQGRSIFVLGDTSYGSCCVDELAGLHHRADFVVHYGQACMSPTSRLPCYFVFGRLPLGDVKRMGDVIYATVNENGSNLSKVVLICDSRYEFARKDIGDRLHERGIDQVVLPEFVDKFRSMDGRGCSHESSTVLGQKLDEEEILGSDIVYIGSESSQVAQIVLRFNSNTVFTFDPLNMECKRASSELLGKRVYKIERARDAQMIGILVGTMGVDGYNRILRHLREIISASGRKSYTFAMGKINPQKLANFPSIDVYVLVACPQNSLIDSKEFFVPIVTPIELEIALGVREWNPTYSTDFTSLLREHETQETRMEGFLRKQAEEENLPHFSLAKGGLVSIQRLDHQRHRLGQAQEQSNEALVKPGPKHITLQYSSPAGDLLEARSFRGLDPGIGDKPPAPARPGQTGIASELYDLGESEEQPKVKQPR